MLFAADSSSPTHWLQRLGLIDSPADTVLAGRRSAAARPDPLLARRAALRPRRPRRLLALPPREPPPRRVRAGVARSSCARSCCCSSSASCCAPFCSPTSPATGRAASSSSSIRARAWPRWTAGSATPTACVWRSRGASCRPRRRSRMPPPCRNLSSEQLADASRIDLVKAVFTSDTFALQESLKRENRPDPGVPLRSQAYARPSPATWASRLSATGHPDRACRRHRRGADAPRPRAARRHRRRHRRQRQFASKRTMEEAARLCLDRVVPLHIWGVGSSEAGVLQVKDVRDPARRSSSTRSPRSRTTRST